ncbi:helix-turn-helix domain-containing protein [Priestia megaterium]|uniref:helix-turn-helix domain-containing protein n=1 Tax=Priestia megaterium TaxID=1404 RepID=UPI001950936E|nr:helix-turn-helix domain-containing protein [Priestia megaterium]MBM6599547.1 helix-turn-helix domain-containing protein [Priestia megaterium]
MRQTITVKEVAGYIGISKDLVYQLVREHKIPHLRIGRRILFRKESLNLWMSNQESFADQFNKSNG